jgi:hypothetical protein
LHGKDRGHHAQLHVVMMAVSAEHQTLEVGAFALDRFVHMQAGPPSRNIRSCRAQASGVLQAGLQATAAQVLTGILIPNEHPPTGAWLGVTAWVTKGRDLRDYEGHETGDDADNEEGGTSR